MSSVINRRFSMAAALSLSLLAGCSSDTAVAPQFQPEVANVADNFAFQVTGLRQVSDSLSYVWRNNGTTANVNQSPSGLQGTATLTILDARGTQVYSRSLLENGTFTTTAGTAGDWRIRIRFSGASGSANFRAQRP